MPPGTERAGSGQCVHVAARQADGGPPTARPIHVACGTAPADVSGVGARGHEFVNGTYVPLLQWYPVETRGFTEQLLPLRVTTEVSGPAGPRKGMPQNPSVGGQKNARKRAPPSGWIAERPPVDYNPALGIDIGTSALRANTTTQRLRITETSVLAPRFSGITNLNSDGSVTTWFGLLQAGQEQAAQQLWERYFPLLLDVARGKMRGISKQTADEEDVALSAFYSFCEAAKDRRIPSVTNRDQLWRTLVLITAGKVVDQRRYLGSQKRSAPHVADSGRAAVVHPIELEAVIGDTPDPAFAAQLAEEFDLLMDRLSDRELRQTALAKLNGYTNEEIAEQLSCSARTVRRRLTVIRRIWLEGDIDSETP